MIKLLFKIVVSLSFLVYIIFNIDWGCIGNTLLQINLFNYATSTFFALICPVFLASKYHLLIKNTPLTLPIPRLIAINYISRFYAIFLPSALGPEAVRWYKVTKNKQGRSFFLASTMVERLFFLIILLSFGTVPLLFYANNQQIILLRQQLSPLLISAYILFCSALLYFLFPGAQALITSIIRKVMSVKIDSRLDQFLENFSLKNLSFSLIGSLFILSILWQFFFIGRMFFLFSAMQLPITIIDITWMGSLVLLLQILPISFAGIGIREGAYAYLFTLYGIPSEKGILIGVLFFTQMLIFSSIGAILNLFES